jgi:hypothetical protein
VCTHIPQLPDVYVLRYVVYVYVHSHSCVCLALDEADGRGPFSAAPLKGPQVIAHSLVAGALCLQEAMPLRLPHNDCMPAADDFIAAGD